MADESNIVDEMAERILMPMQKLISPRVMRGRMLDLTTRTTMRTGLADRIVAATDHELKEQSWPRQTDDFKEGIKATSQRRTANFVGR